MRALAIKALFIIAARGPIAWAARWSRRAHEGQLDELIEHWPMTFADVLPWDARPSRPIFTGGSDSVDERSATQQPEMLSTCSTSLSQAEG